MVAFAYAWMSPLLIVFSVAFAGAVFGCLYRMKMRRIQVQGEPIQSQVEQNKDNIMTI